MMQFFTRITVLKKVGIMEAAELCGREPEDLLNLEEGQEITCVVNNEVKTLFWINDYY